jgi:glycosyltransferase involved in cell wall biosynthesis
MKILFAGRKFDGVAGGVERTSIQLMNGLISRGHEVHLLTWDFETANSFYPQNAKIRWHKLNMGDAMVRASWNLRIRRFLRIRKIVKRLNPDLIIAFQHGTFLSVRLSVFGLNIPVIAAERNAPHRFDHIRAGRLRRLIYLSFLLAKKIVIQFEEYRAIYPKFLWSRIEHIPNPVTIPILSANDSSTKRISKTILFVGHFEFQKNPSVLLRAFANIAPNHSEWNLVMVGRGSLQKELENISRANNIMDQVSFPGNTTNINELYRSSEIYCIPSRWEGFPNALAEALSYGLPSVGFKESAGVNLLISHNENGILAEGNNNLKSLERSLLALIVSKKLRYRLKTNTMKTISSFDPNMIEKEWEKLAVRSIQ